MNTIKEEKKRIIERLENLKVLEEFKYVKSKSAFVLKGNGLSKRLYLECYVGADEDGFALEIKPYFGIQFVKVQKSLSRFYHGAKSDYNSRDNYFVFPKYDTEHQYNILFSKYGGDTYESSFTELENIITKQAITFFNTFDSIENFYKQVTKNIFDFIPFGGGGIWIFEQLLVSKLADVEGFKKLEPFLHDYQKKLFDEKEPNAEIYYPKYNEIVNFIKEL